MWHPKAVQDKLNCFLVPMSGSPLYANKPARNKAKGGTPKAKPKAKAEAAAKLTAESIASGDAAAAPAGSVKDRRLPLAQ